MPPNSPTPPPDPAPHDTLDSAFADFFLHPHRNIVLAWSWKTAILSAIFRALIFLSANRHTGLRHELTTVSTEAAYALFASGLLGAMTQRLRDTQPLWATAFIVWLGMPTLMLAAEAEIQHLAGTPHLRAGLTTSFLFASIASGFTWYAMRCGTLLQDAGDDSLSHDARTLPRVVRDFTLWPIQQLRRRD